jgi:hypothetical protein
MRLSYEEQKMKMKKEMQKWEERGGGGRSVTKLTLLLTVDNVQISIFFSPHFSKNFHTKFHENQTRGFTA